MFNYLSDHEKQFFQDLVLSSAFTYAGTHIFSGSEGLLPDEGSLLYILLMADVIT